MKQIKITKCTVCAVVLVFLILITLFFLSGKKRIVKQAVVVANPEVILNYPEKYLPIQYIKYSKFGLWDNRDVPEFFFPKPYSVNIQPKAGEELSIVAVGDIMAHADLQFTAYLHRNDPGETAGGYDWILSPLKKILLAPDLTIGNLETPVAPEFPYSGLNKTFNASPLLLKGLKNVGFDILQTANNHALDEGEKGLLDTLHEIKKQKFNYIGAYDDLKNKDLIKIVNCNNFKIAMLNYTFLSNNKPGVPNYLHYLSGDMDRVNIISKNIDRANKMGAEFVILFIHWGREYHKMPKLEDRALALALFENGADMIIGAHPHVIQPMEIVYTKNGKIIQNFETGAKEHFIAYSLGNFISHQRGMSKFCMVLEFGLVKNSEGIFLQRVNPIIIENEIGTDEDVYCDYTYTFNTYRPHMSSWEKFKQYIKKK